MRFLALVPLIGLLAACGGGGNVPPPVTPAARAPLPGNVSGVIGRDARGLAALFGPADQDVRAMAARRLQFASPVCVLDAYLYAKDGKGEAVVTWIDTRTPAGADIDRASCIAALQRRTAAK